MDLVRFAVLFAIFAIGASAQTPEIQEPEDNQSWNDVQLTVPLGKQVDFFTKLTLRLGKKVTRLNDGRFAIGFVWKPTKALSISPFYWYVNARNAVSQFRIENRLNFSATYRFPVKRFGLSHRSTVERRLRRPLDSWRYRAQVTIDKDIPEKIISNAKWVVSNEVFYDSLLERFSRNRFAVGVAKTLNKNLALDVYYMRQNDGIARPGDLNIIGTAWKIKM